MKTATQSSFSTLQLKALELSVVTEIKFGQPLAKNAKFVKAQFKKARGLASNTDNKTLLGHIAQVYDENGLHQKRDALLKKILEL